MVGRRGEGDRPARAVAAARAARSLQPRRGLARRHRAGRASVQRAAALGRRRHELRHLPSSRAATGATGGPRRWGGPSSTAARRRCGTWATRTGSAGTARAIRCGRSRSGRSSIRARWRAMPPASPACCARTRRWPAATSARSATRPGADDEKLLVDAAKALAAFQATLVSPRTPFDAFRDALLAGDREAAARYPLAAQRGLKIFIEAQLRGLPFRAALHQRRVRRCRHPVLHAAGRGRYRPPGRARQARQQHLQPFGPAQRRCLGRQRLAHQARAAPAQQFRRVPRAQPAPGRARARSCTTAISRRSRTS